VADLGLKLKTPDLTPNFRVRAHGGRIIAPPSGGP
jgi:hypothetical protein